MGVLDLTRSIRRESRRYLWTIWRPGSRHAKAQRSEAFAQYALFETIQVLRAGRTVVLISYRFSTVRSADGILVLHEGGVVEQGSHAQLMLAGGRYARMYSLQSRAYIGA